MFRIRRIHDAATAANRERIGQVQEILRAQFAGLPEADVQKLPERLENPLKHGFRSILFVAENARGAVRGFALLLHAPDLGFCFLDFISTVKGETGRGIGGALYERVREEAAALDVVGLFFECWPDDAELSRDPAVLAQNAARLKFYERYGARPVANTQYATPLKPGEDNPPLLVFDGLGKGRLPERAQARKIVRAILERKYGARCPPEYVERVTRSFEDDPIELRPPRYTKAASVPPTGRSPKQSGIALIVNDAHQIHHVRERGYVQSPVRISSILEESSTVRRYSSGRASSASPFGTSKPCMRASSCGFSSARRATFRAENPCIRTCFRSAIMRAGLARCRCARATIASTPLRRSTRTRTARPCAPSIAH